MNSMTKEIRSLLGLALIVIPFILALFFSIKSKDLLIPGGYDLAIDGYVVARTLMIIFTIYLSTKIGFKIYESAKKE